MTRKRAQVGRRCTLTILVALATGSVRRRGIELTSMSSRTDHQSPLELLSCTRPSKVRRYRYLLRKSSSACQELKRNRACLEAKIPWLKLRLSIRDSIVVIASSIISCPQSRMHDGIMARCMMHPGSGIIRYLGICGLSLCLQIHIVFYSLSRYFSIACPGWLRLVS